MSVYPKPYVLCIITLVLCSLIYCSASYAQKPGKLFDTVYYDKYNYPIKAKYAYLYREPAVKDGNHYTATWRLIDGTPLMTCTYVPAVVDYHYSIEDGVGYKDGPVVFYKDDYVSCVGEFKDNKPTGVWRSFYKGGKKIREIKSFDSSGEQYTEMVFDTNSNKVFTGICVRSGWKVDASDVFLAAIRNPMRLVNRSFHPEGPFTVLKNKRPIVVINFSGGLNGSCAYFDPETGKKCLKGSFKDYKKSGDWERYDRHNGRLVEKFHYEDGLLEGGDTTYVAATGAIKGYKMYKGGYLTGNCKTFFDNSEKIAFEAHYWKDKGTAIVYDSLTGNVLEEGEVNDKGRNGKWRAYHVSNGKLAAEGIYQNRMPHGPWVKYDTLGYTREKISFLEGTIDGSYELFFDYSDKLWLAGKFRNDKLSDSMTVYYRNGKVHRNIYFQEGKEIYQRCLALSGEQEECQQFRITATPGENVMDYFGKNLRYPEDARIARLEGKVKVGYWVNEKGETTDITVLEGFDKSCDAEAKRLIEEMPLWQPAVVDNIPLSSYHTATVPFYLRENDDLLPMITGK